MKQISSALKALRILIAVVAILSGGQVSAQWYFTANETSPAYGATAQTIPAANTDYNFAVGPGTGIVISVTQGVLYKFTTCKTGTTLTPVSGSNGTYGSTAFDTRITGYKDGETTLPRFFGSTGVCGSHTVVEWVADFTGSLRVCSSRGAGGAWAGAGIGNSHVLTVRRTAPQSLTTPTLTATAVPASNKITLNYKEPSSNLVAYVPFEERAGTSVYDYSPNGLTGTWYNGNSSTAGVSATKVEGIARTSIGGTGSAGTFGANFVDIPANSANGSKFDFGTGAFTYMCWIYPTSHTGSNTIFEVGTFSTQHILFRLEASTLALWINGSNVANYPFNPTNNNWYHVALTRNTSTNNLEFYVNGYLVGTTAFAAATSINPSTSAASNLGAATQVLRIGCSAHAATQYFNGRIDEFRVYNTNLTADQIHAIGAQGFRSYTLNKGSSATNVALLKGTAESDGNFWDIDNFESGVESWSSRDGVTPAVSSTAYSGIQGLSFTAPWGRNFENGSTYEGAQTNTGFNTDNYPFLNIAYNVPATSGILNILLYKTSATANWYSVTGECDNNSSYPYSGTYLTASSSIKPFIADGNWHYKSINLREMFGANQTFNAFIFWAGTGPCTVPGTTGYPFNVDDVSISAKEMYGNPTWDDAANIVDVAAPTVPTGLAVAATSSTQLTPSWSAATDNGTTYYYSAKPYDGLANIGTAGTANAVFTKGLNASAYWVDNVTSTTNSGWISGTSTAFTGLTANTQYCFTVKARDAATTPNESAVSSQVCKYTKATCVTSFTATTSTTTCGAINLAWSGGAWTNVRVRCTTTASDIYTGNATSFIHTGLTAGSTYAYEIYVRNGDALEEAVCSGLTPSAVAPALPTLTTAATPAVVNRVCISASAQTTSLPYTASTGSATSYSISWTGLAAQASTSYTFLAGSGSVSGIVVPAGTAAGTYSGTMTYTNALGCSNTKTITLTVDAYPDLSPAANPSPVCENGSAVSLTASPSSVWSVSGNGSLANTSTSATTNSFTPAAFTGTAASQTATLTLTNGACVNSTRTIRVDNQNSITGPTANPSPVCENATMALTGDIAGVVWTSSLGGFGATSPGQNATFTPSLIAGTSPSSTGTIVATNGACSTTLNIRVDNQNSITAPTANPSPVCETGTIATTGDIANVVWSSSLGSFGATSPGQNATFTPTAITGSTQNVTGTIVATNGSCSASVNIRVDNNPTAYAGVDQAKCNTAFFTMAPTDPTTGGNAVAGSSGTWSCFSGCGGVTVASTMTGTTSGVGTGVPATMRWTVVNGACSVSDDVILTNDQQNSISGNTTLCDFNSTSNSYSYTSTPGSTVWSVSATPSANAGSIDNAGNYTPVDLTGNVPSQAVVITAQNGTCSANYNVVLYNQPTISSPGISAICQGTVVPLVADITTGVTWAVSQGASTCPGGTSSGCFTGLNFTAPDPGTSSATYRIKASTQGACFSDVIFQIDKGLTFSGFSTPTTMVCDNATLTGLGVNPAAKWSVVAGTGTGTLAFNTPTLSTTNTFTPANVSLPTASQTATIHIESNNGACFYDKAIRIDNQNSLSTPTSPICESTTAVTNAVVGDVNGVTWSVGMGTGLTGSAAVANGSSSKNADVTYGSVAAPTQNATLTVTATNGVCTAPSVNIQVDNNNSIISAQTPICETGSSFIDGDVDGVVWTATAGSFTSPAQDITLSGVTVTSGQLDVTVTATNGSCPPKTTHVFVDDSPNTASFSTSATSPICASGTSTIGINAASLGTGTFTVTYNLSAPNAATGLTASVALSSGVGSFTTGALSSTGTTTITLTSIQNAAGCSATLTTGNTANIVVNAAPTVAITGFENVCEGTSITLTANPSGGAGSATNYKWERSNNGGSSWTIVQNTASATYATSSALTPGNYLYKVTVTQSGSNCSAVSSNVSANVAAQPFANDASMQADICKGGSATFTASVTGGGTPTLLYEWVYSDLTSLSSGTPTGHTYTNVTTNALTIATDNTTATAGTTSYVLKVYATGTGCNASFSVSNDLNVYADPSVSAPSPAVQSGICAGGSAAAISVTAAGGPGSYSYQWYENTTNSNSGGTLISGATSASYTPTVVAGSRYYYVVVTVTGNGCGTATSATAEVTGSSSTMTATAAVDQCVSVGTLDKYYVLVTATGGTPPYTYTGAVYTSPTGEGVYELNPGTTTNYTVSDAGGCVATTNNVTTVSGHPTNITLTPSSAGFVTSDCWVSNFNKWVTFRDGVTNEAIMAINDNQNNLGLVTVNVYKEATAPVILSDQYVNAGGCGGPSTAMRRHFAVTTTSQPTTGVDVALFFTDQEYIDLKNDAFNSNIPYPQPGYECSNDDDVYNFSGLYVTKYSGPSVDGDYGNNVATAGYYKVFGDNTSPYLPLTKGEYTGSNTGFQGIYGGAQTHHYVQLTVTEFSEFWIHGSSHASALPVRMIFFQADAVNNSYIRLSWATAIEVNNRGFEVERSVDGQTWAKVGFVEGHNNSTTQNTYSYDDKDVVAGVIYFYRLKQVDNDGAFEYTDIVSAKLKADATFGVKEFVPNPTMNKTNLIITAVKDQEISVTFYNLVGQKVMESNMAVNKGYNQFEFDLEKLAAGTYTAVVSAANEVYTKKIVLTK